MINIRNYTSCDANIIGDLAVDAYSEYSKIFDNWSNVSKNMRQFPSLNSSAEIIIAESLDKIAGFVAYIPANSPKQKHFPREYPVISGLSVLPACRGVGIGKMLTQECIERAIRDKSESIVLHTSNVMKIAVIMYTKLGFRKFRKPYLRNGLEYQLYIKELNN